MARVLRMPDVADDPSSATLTAWLVGESGDFVGAQSLATVETDTSLLSIEVAEPGVLIRSLVEPGDRVEPGSPLAVLAEPGEVIEDVEQLMMQLGLAIAPDAEDTSVHLRAVPSGDALYATTWPHESAGTDSPEHAETESAETEPAEIEPPAAVEAESAEPEPPETLQAEPAEPEPSEAEPAEPEPEPEPAAALPQSDAPAEVIVEPTFAAPTEAAVDEPVVVRRVVGWADSVAAAVVDAVLDVEPKPAESAPGPVPRQVQVHEVVRADELLTIVAKVDEVSLIALVVKAVAVTSRSVALRRDTTSITDVALQRWSPSGTVAPVVHVANLMTVSSLSSTLLDLDTRAREGRLAAGELEPASVTVVDLGSEGVAEGTVDATAVHPAVLTVGSVRVQPVVEGGVLVPGRVLAISLSCDAQRIDTTAAARWLAHLAALLEQPLQFLT